MQKNSLFLLIIFYILFMPATILADNGQNQLNLNDDSLLGDDFSFKAELKLRSHVRVVDSNTVTRIGLSTFSLQGGIWEDRIRAVITAKLDRILRVNGDSSMADDFDIEDFIKEAYIEIKNLPIGPNGRDIAVAFVIGKQEIPFGNHLNKMPLFEDNPIFGIHYINQVYGFTVRLEENLFENFEMLEVSAFETESKDLRLGRVDGASVRLSMKFYEEWYLKMSYAFLGHRELQNEDQQDEQRGSIGLLYKDKDGKFCTWVEGIVITNNAKYPDAHFAVTLGGEYRIWTATDIVVEYTYVEKSLQEIGLAFKVALHRNIQVGAEVRYRDNLEGYAGNDDQWIFGVGVSILFGIENEDLKTYFKQNLFDEYVTNRD